MKKLFLLLSLARIVVACNKDKITGTGNVTSQERSVASFTDVVVNG